MTKKHRSFRNSLSMAGALVAAMFALPLQAQTEPPDGPPARGLIVRLKQPVANESLHPRGANPRARAGTQESVRWQRVLGEAGLSGASGRVEPRLRPVGRDQQLIEFERPLSRREAASLRDKLMARPDVDWVEPNLRERRLQASPSDPLFPRQWWLQPVSGSNANTLNARLRGVSGFQTAWLRANHAPVVVAVLDTGITSHPDLAGRVLPGYDFVDDWDPVAGVGYSNDGDRRDADPSDPGDWVSASDRAADPARYSDCAIDDKSSWHGTIVAGMVVANVNNSEGGAGIHWGTSVLPVRVAGKCGADLNDIVDGMRWAAGLRVVGVPDNPKENWARIINISFGGSAACGPAYQSTVDELRAIGVVVVAAAGNEWSAAPSRPASCVGVVGVVGLNRDGFKTNYSSFGGQIGVSGLAAVAGDDSQGAWGRLLADTGLVTLTNLGDTVPAAGGYAVLFGTSFAAPQVSGTIAHMLGLNPALSYEQIVQGLRASARPHVTSPKVDECSDSNPGRCICTASTCGAGILDADRALIYASGLVLPSIQAAVIDNAEVDAAVALASQDRPSNVVQVSSSSSGGGAFGGFWLLALATAALTLPALRTPRCR
jgi:serine protease